MNRFTSFIRHSKIGIRNLLILALCLSASVVNSSPELAPLPAPSPAAPRPYSSPSTAHAAEAMMAIITALPIQPPHITLTLLANSVQLCQVQTSADLSTWTPLTNCIGPAQLTLPLLDHQYFRHLWLAESNSVAGWDYGTNYAYPNAALVQTAGRWTLVTNQPISNPPQRSGYFTVPLLRGPSNQLVGTLTALQVPQYQAVPPGLHWTSSPPRLIIQ